MYYKLSVLFLKLCGCFRHSVHICHVRHYSQDDLYLYITEKNMVVYNNCYKCVHTGSGQFCWVTCSCSLALRCRARVLLPKHLRCSW